MNRDQMNEEFDDLNPLTQELKTICDKLRDLGESEQKLVGEIEWYHKIDGPMIQVELQKLCSTRIALEQCIAQDEQELARLNWQIQQLHSQIGSWWNPFNWFNPGKRQLRREARHLEKRYRNKENSLQTLISDLRQCVSQWQTLQDTWERYCTFDQRAHEEKLAELRNEIDSLRQQQHKLERRWNRVEQALAPFRDQLKTLDDKGKTIHEQIADLRQKSQRAASFDEQLTQAPDAFRRAQIHQRCEQELGCGSPRQIIRECDQRRKELERELRNLERTKEKLRTRARQVAERVAREIEALILDGNNLCYEGDAFIGLAALKVLVPLLAEKYSAVYVVFDASIRWHLKTGDDKVRRELERNCTVHVHIVPSRQTADETILDLAAQSPTTFIISNDRFAEFQDKPPVREGRILHHQIVNGMIRIAALDIAVSYRKAR